MPTRLFGAQLSGAKTAVAPMVRLKRVRPVQLFAALATAIAAAPVYAQLPVAPFTSPEKLFIPANTPIIETGVYRKARWLQSRPSTDPSWMSDEYIGTPRRRGNIVSFYAVTRTMRKETQRLNRHTKNYGAGLFLPGYTVYIHRYDCANDRWSLSSPLSITDAWGDEPGSTGAFQHPVNRAETKWRTTPGQVRVIIEGLPYWAMDPRRDPRHEDKPLEWQAVVPSSYGATHLDYACTRL